MGMSAVSSRSGWRIARHADFLPALTSTFIGSSLSRVRKDHIRGMFPNARDQPAEQQRRRNCPCKLGKKGKWHIQGSDAGERVAERPSNCDSRIGKKR